jgi:protein involved in polysaccharide export with SLBB domain
MSSSPGGCVRDVPRRAFLSLIFLAPVTACGPSAEPESPKLAAATENTTLGPGDLFRMQIVGEKDLPAEFQVAADGTVTFPYVHEMKVAGLEPQEVSQKIRQALIEKKILTDPSVVVSVTEYRSKTVTLLGQVQKPGSFPLSPGMTLLQAVSMAGGFTSVAQKNRVNLARVKDGKAKTVVIDVEAIYEGSEEDIFLQSGDRIYVHERVF